MAPGTAAADGHLAVVDGSVVTAPCGAPIGFEAALIELTWPDHPIAGQLRTLLAAEHAGP